MPLKRRLQYDISEFDELMNDFSEEVSEFMNALVETLSDEALIAARRLATDRLPSRGDTYAPTIFSRDLGRTSTFRTMEVYSEHEWATAIEYGTKPHEIAAKNVKALKMERHVMNPQQGKSRPYGIPYYYSTHYSRSPVQHPGARPFYIFRDTLNTLASIFNNVVDKTWKRLVK